MKYADDSWVTSSHLKTNPGKKERKKERNTEPSERRCNQKSAKTRQERKITTLAIKKRLTSPNRLILSPSGVPPGRMRLRFPLPMFFQNPHALLMAHHLPFGSLSPGRRAHDFALSSALYVSLSPRFSLYFKRKIFQCFALSSVFCQTLCGMILIFFLTVKQSRHGRLGTVASFTGKRQRKRNNCFNGFSTDFQCPKKIKKWIKLKQANQVFCRQLCTKKPCAKNKRRMRHSTALWKIYETAETAFPLPLNASVILWRCSYPLSKGNGR